MCKTNDGATPSPTLPLEKGQGGSKRPVLPVDEGYWREITNWPPRFVLAVANAAFELAMKRLKCVGDLYSREKVSGMMQYLGTRATLEGGQVVDDLGPALRMLDEEVRRLAELADAAVLMRDLAEEGRATYTNTAGATPGGAFFGDWHAQEHLIEWLPVMLRELDRANWLIDFGSTCG